MSKIQHKKLWMYGGAFLLVIISSLPILFTKGPISPWFPMPIYLGILYWVLRMGYILVMPFFYLLEFRLLETSNNFGRYVLIASLMIAVLNAWYFHGAWEYGVDYQSLSHTQIVAILNLVGFSALIILALYGELKKSKPAQLMANLLLFLLLSWCAFPYLGEMP